MYACISSTRAFYNFLGCLWTICTKYKETLRRGIRVTSRSDCSDRRQCCVSRISSKNFANLKIKFWHYVACWCDSSGTLLPCLSNMKIQDSSDLSFHYQRICQSKDVIFSFFPRHKIHFQVRLLLKSKDLNLLIRLPWKILSSVSFAPSLGQFLVGATERWNKVSNFSRCDTSYFFYSYSHCSQTSHTMYHHLLLLLSTLFNVQMFTSLCLALYNVQCSSHGWLQVREDREQEMFRAFQINFC